MAKKVLSHEEIERRLTNAMDKAFSKSKNRRKAIHIAAAAGAGIVAVLPVGLDVWALRLAEILMVVYIADSYGEKLTKSVAKGWFLSSFAQLAGETFAFAALEALETSKYVSAVTIVGPIAAYFAKAGIAVGLIETVGHLVIKHYEKPNSIAGKVCKTAEIFGVMADISRVIDAFSGLTETLGENSSNMELSGSGDNVSFTGHPINPAKKKEALKQVNNMIQDLKDAKQSAKLQGDLKRAALLSKAEQQTRFLESRILQDNSLGAINSKLLDVQHAIKQASRKYL